LTRCSAIDRLDIQSRFFLGITNAQRESIDLARQRARVAATVRVEFAHKHRLVADYILSNFHSKNRKREREGGEQQKRSNKIHEFRIIDNLERYRSFLTDNRKGLTILETFERHNINKCACRVIRDVFYASIKYPVFSELAELSFRQIARVSSFFFVGRTPATRGCFPSQRVPSRKMGR